MEARLQGERMGSVKKKKKKITVSVDSLDRISLRKKDGSGFSVRLD